MEEGTTRRASSPRGLDGEPEKLDLRVPFEKIAATVPGMICSFRLRPSGTVSVPFATTAMRNLFDLDPADVREDATPLFERMHPDDAARVRASLAESARTMSPWRDEFRVRHPLKGELWVGGHSMPEREPAGSILWHGHVQEITERRLATQAAVSRVLADSTSLRDATPRVIRTLCESEGWDFGSVWEVDRRADAIRCARTWHVDGLPADSLVERSLATPLPKGAGLAGRVWAEVAPVVVADIRSDSLRPLASYAAEAGLSCAVGIPILRGCELTGALELFAREGRGPDPRFLEMMVGIGRQVGEFVGRMRAQEAEERFVSSSPAVIYALTPKESGFRVKWASGNLHRMTGYRPEEITDEWWFDHVHPDDRALVIAKSPYPYDVEYQSLEFRFRRKDGSYFWVHDEKRLLRGRDGSRDEIVGSWLDVTERVRLEEQLRQSQKMEAIGRLAGGVAHDFNNLLTVIGGYSEMLLEMLPDGDSKRPLVGDIRDAGERAAALTRQLLAFGRKQLLEPKVLDLNEVLADLDKMLRRLIGEDIVLTTSRCPSAALVRVDPSQIEQVVTNLVVNARDAMPHGGSLTIETRELDLKEKDRSLYPETRPGRYAELSVRDTGYGMSPEVQARIFEPFFTTKGPGRGTGLGLATVFGIVKQSDGHIEVQSRPGVGTCFSILLPSARQEALPAAADHPREGPDRGSETVLLVEDDESVRRIVRNTLESRGYRVLECPDGWAALATLEAAEHPVDLLVTDVVMPEMSGRNLAELIRARKPGLKVLLISGYSEEPQSLLRLAGDAFLQKPFSPSALARRVRELLDGS